MPKFCGETICVMWKVKVAKLRTETFRFEDENDYEYEI